MNKLLNINEYKKSDIPYGIWMKKQKSRLTGSGILFDSALLDFRLAGTILAVAAENEGFAVNALVYGGILFMSADHDTFKRTVIAGMRMVRALGNSTGDRVVRLFHLFH